MAGMSGRLAQIAAVACLLAAPAVAQSSGVEVIQTAPKRPGPEPGIGGSGLRMVKSGALLLASFDQNFDGAVTDEEVETGARASFAVADRDGNGALGGFEQGDWANKVGAADDVLSNPMLFDVDLDRSVTLDEFVAGVRRLAVSARGPGSDVLHFSDLLRAPSDRNDREEGD